MRWTVFILFVAACGPAPRTASDANGDITDANPNAPDSALATFVYAHTATELFRVDPETLQIQLVGPFVWSNGRQEMTDIAIDGNGAMIGISYDSVYRIDATTANATRISNQLTGDFNGLTYVPAALLGQSGPDVLVASRNTDGKIFRVDPNTGAATQIGNMGTNVTSSGDIVAVQGLGILLTGDTGASSDVLQRLAPPSLAASAIGSSIGFSDIWGVGFWKNKVFGFSSNGDFVTIDRTSGVGTRVSSSGRSWFGAAVSTLAPVVE